MTRRRLILAVVAAVLCGVAWWLSLDRLSAEERLLVGRWTFDGTSRTYRIEMQFWPDRQCHYGFGRPGWTIAYNSGRWFVRSGELVVDGEPRAVRRVLRPVLSGLGYPSPLPDTYRLDSITANELVLVMPDGTREPGPAPRRTDPAVRCKAWLGLLVREVLGNLEIGFFGGKVK